MLLSITTTYNPATDLGYLLHKNPFVCQSTDLPFGTVNIFFPIATNEKCTVAILLDIDPVELVRGRKKQDTSVPLEQYVNDRPYVCSSFMSVALARVFTQAMNGRCKKRPELVETMMPLTCNISVLPCKGGEYFLRKLFEPLGYKVTTERHVLDERFPEWGDSPYFTVALAKDTTVCELLNHLYVLIPVLDNQKHYYIDKAEIEKLLKRGEGWLAVHPEKEQIVRRYLKFKTSYASEALARLTDISPAEQNEDVVGESCEESIERALDLNTDRLGTVLSALKVANAETVLDLGCGEGKLLRLLLKDTHFKKIIGMDVSIKALENAAERLNLDSLPAKQKERIELIHGSLMYRDRRFEGFEAAAVVEVIEHLDEPRLMSFERVLFEFARPGTIVLTTPNREYNVRWEKVGSEKLRHKDHRFEWTRSEFSRWANRVAERFNYSIRFLPVGNVDEEVGSPTQMCIFTRNDISNAESV